MILNLFIETILYVISGIFYIVPTATIADLPLYGSQISSVLYEIMGTWNAFLEIFPYGLIAWHIFLWVIIPFELALLVMKFFLGSRVPANVE